MLESAGDLFPLPFLNRSVTKVFSQVGSWRRGVLYLSWKRREAYFALLTGDRIIPISTGPVGGCLICGVDKLMDVMVEIHNFCSLPCWWIGRLAPEIISRTRRLPLHI